MEEGVKVLCVDDEVNVLHSLERLFIDADFDFLTAASAEEGIETLEKEGGTVQVVISDYRMPGMSGVDFLGQVYQRWPETIRIVLSGYADTASVVAAINEGHIYKFIPKPWNDDELKVTIDKAIEIYFLRRRNRELTEELTKSNEELRLLNENLEKIVWERTDELLFRNRALAGVQNIFSQMPCGVVGIDSDGLIVQINRTAEEILGREGGSCLGVAAEKGLPAELFALLAGVTGDSGVRTGGIVIGHRRYLAKISMIANVEGQAGMVVVLDECGPAGTNSATGQGEKT